MPQLLNVHKLQAPTDSLHFETQPVNILQPLYPSFIPIGPSRNIIRAPEPPSNVLPFPLPLSAFPHALSIMARTKQTARRPAASSKANGTTDTAKTPLGPAGTRHEYKRVDYLYSNETGSWIYRDSAPFTGQEVGTALKSRPHILTRASDG
jgi:hypothetical protein